PVPLRPAEAQVAAHLRKTDATDEPPVGRPHGDAAVADGPARVARAPHVAVHIAAHAVGRALHAVDREIGESLLVRQLAVASHVERKDFAFAARAGVARALSGADDVELLVVGREGDAVWIGQLIFADDERDLAGAVDAVDAGWQFALQFSCIGVLTESRP